MQLYRETLSQAGHAAHDIEVAGAYHCFVADTPEQARQTWERHYMRYLHFVGPLIGPPEKIPGKQYDAWKRLGENLRHVTFDQMYPNLVLCGDPSQCVDRIGLLQEELGLSNLMLYMDLGGLDQKELRGSYGAFCDQGHAPLPDGLMALRWTVREKSGTGYNRVSGRPQNTMIQGEHLCGLQGFAEDDESGISIVHWNIRVLLHQSRRSL